jgi:hypothetical protein
MGKEHKDRAILGEYDRYFRSLPLAYTYLQDDESPPAHIRVVLDARKSFTKPAFTSTGGTIPDELMNHVPLRTSADYGAQYLWSTDRKTLVAYIYNVTGHVSELVEINTKYHRVPKPAVLKLTLQNLPPALRLRLFDLSAKTILKDFPTADSNSCTISNTRSDFLLLISA